MNASIPKPGIFAANDILAQRPSKLRDADRESRLLDSLVARISLSPDTALQALVETAVEMTGSGSAGVSIRHHDRFVWPAVAGVWARYSGGGMPLDASPCGVVIGRNQAMLFDKPHLLFPDSQGYPLINEILLVPLSHGAEPFGTIWLLSHDDYRFTYEDARILTRLGLFAAAIWQQDGLRASERRLSGQVDGTREALRIIRSISQRYVREARGEAEITAAELGGRIQAYSDVFIRFGEDDRVDLWLLVADQVRRSGERDGERLSIDGPNIDLSRNEAALMSLAAHELFDNSYRYGALEAQRGAVSISWQKTADGRLRFTWAETNPSTLFTAATKNGFGFEYLCNALPELTGGNVSMEVRPPGLRFEWDFVPQLPQTEAAPILHV